MDESEYEFNWEESDPDEGSDEPKKQPTIFVHMIEVVNGVYTKGVDGLYLRSAGLIEMLERDIEVYFENDLEEEASVLEEFLGRIRLMIAQREIHAGPYRA